jgi:hypothetical protein
MSRLGKGVGVEVDIICTSIILKMSNLKLREVIKQIRQCKTAAEERAVISKESALIRNAFKVSYHHQAILLTREELHTFSFQG